jgi:rhodanese-related sulfurtransferase
MKKVLKRTLFFVAVTVLLHGCIGVYEDASELAQGWGSAAEQITPQQLDSIAGKGEDILIIDIREEGEYYEGSIPGSVNISRGILEFSIAEEEFWAQQFMYPPEKDSIIIICSQNGEMGILAAISLKKLGYTNVLNLEGGFESYKQSFN